MFLSLFLRECRQILRSLVYYIYAVVLICFLSSQLGEGLVDDFAQPQPGQNSYGTVNSKEPAAIMEKTLAGLVMETERNAYATYPLGFYKQVNLNEEELAQIKDILKACTGKEWEVLIQEMNRHYAEYDRNTIEGSMAAQISYAIVPREGLSYEEFSEHMHKVCKIIGRGSSYQKEKIDQGVGVPMTYEQAVEEFEALCKEDRITGAAARIFCDYAGIILSVLPIFLGVTRCLRDKRAKAAQVIYAHKASSFHIIASRYLANVVLALLPAVIMALVVQMPCQYHAKTLGVTPDVLAFLKYSFVWLLPEIMAVLAAAFLLTELTESIISIFVQVFWAFASIFGAVSLAGDFGFSLVARWNQIGGTAEFLRQKESLLINRGFYFGLSLALLALAIAAYEKKRREGETIYGKIFKRGR